MKAKIDHVIFMKEANQQIGEAFWNGTCVNADPVIAGKYIEIGLRPAFAHRTGTGVAADLPTAASHAHAIDEEDDPEDSVELGEIALLNHRPEEARQKFESGANGGSRRALERLADYWEKGIAGPADKTLPDKYRRSAVQLKVTVNRAL